MPIRDKIKARLDALIDSKVEEQAQALSARKRTPVASERAKARKLQQQLGTRDLAKDGETIGAILDELDDLDARLTALEGR